MHPSHPVIVKRINQLLLAGYHLNKMPTWTTNAGWVIDYSVHDVPGKVGLICTQGFKYGLLVGDLVDGILVNVEAEFSSDSENTNLIDYFYQQVDNYLNRVVALFKPHGEQTEATRAIIKQLDNSILEAAWSSVHLFEVNIERRMYLDDSPCVVNVKRKPNGNGVISVTTSNGGYFYIQFEKGQVMAFNTKGFTRDYVLSELANILKLS